MDSGSRLAGPARAKELRLAAVVRRETEMAWASAIGQAAVVVVAAADSCPAVVCLWIDPDCPAASCRRRCRTDSAAAVCLCSGPAFYRLSFADSAMVKARA